MNVLLTSAGRRTTLLKAFRSSLHRRGGSVLAGDMDGLAPALYLADRALNFPPVGDSRFLPALLEAVVAHQVRALVPTIDPELPLLARAVDQFQELGCQVMLSGRRLVEIAADKYRTAVVFSKARIRVPRQWLPEEALRAALPNHVVVKPRDGSASRDVHRIPVRNVETVVGWVPNPLVEEAIDAPEITVDALLDLRGRPVHFVPRRRIKTLAGESIEGVTLADPILSDWVVRVLETCGSLGGLGPLTLQCFLTEGEPTLSEINPRFGGGFPLTLAAGGDYPEWILQMLEGVEVPSRIGDYRSGLYMTRFYEELILEQPLWQ